MDWNVFWKIIVFLGGLIAGSFLNSVIFRIDNLMAIVKERSICPHCKKEIRWYDLFPLLSFVALRGACRNCGKKISWQYPVVELGTALVFLALYLNFGLTYYTLFLGIVSLSFIVIFVADLREMIIPDIMLWPAIVIWFIFWIIYAVAGGDMGTAIPFAGFLYGALIFGGFIGLIVLVTKGKGMGIGDIKLALLLGFVLGWPSAVVSIFFAFIIGSVVGLMLIASKKKSLKSKVPFAPFMIVGFYFALFWGEKIINWYIK